MVVLKAQNDSSIYVLPITKTVGNGIMHGTGTVSDCMEIFHNPAASSGSVFFHDQVRVEGFLIGSWKMMEGALVKY